MYECLVANKAIMTNTRGYIVVIGATRPLVPNAHTILTLPLTKLHSDNAP